MAIGLQARPNPALDTAEDQRRAYRQFDIVLVVLMFFLFMGLYHIVAMLTVGDWDFWVDWKDRRWWILLTPVILISMPGAVQYIFWEKFRLPFAATLLTLCLVVAEWLNRVINMHGWAYFPLDFIWPSTLIPSGIALDVVLLLTGSYLNDGDHRRRSLVDIILSHQLGNAGALHGAHQHAWFPDVDRRRDGLSVRKDRDAGVS